MKIEEKELIKKIDSCKETLRLYLCRLEFKHITYCYNLDNERIYKNVKDTDIQRLYALRHRRKYNYEMD